MSVDEVLSRTAERLSLPELGADLTADQLEILERLGGWLLGLTEGRLPPLTPQQRDFANLLTRPKSAGEDSYACAWRRYAPIYYLDQLMKLVDRAEFGGSGHDVAGNVLWVPSGSAKRERFGFSLTEEEKEYFRRLGNNADVEALLFDENDPRPLIVSEPERLFADLLGLHRRGVPDLEGSAVAMIRRTIVPHVAVFVADKYDTSEVPEYAIVSDGWLTAYCEKVRLPVTNAPRAVEILSAVGNTVPWQGIEYYLVPSSQLPGFVAELLALVNCAGPYGTSRMLEVLQRAAHVKGQQRAAADAEYDNEEGEAHYQGAEDSDDDVAFQSTAGSSNPYGPEDPDSYEYLQDIFDPESPSERDEDRDVEGEG